METKDALLGGLAGATVLTLVHEGTRHLVPNAPRMDLLGMQGITKLLKGIGKNPPEHDTLYGITMAGDVVSNALYYSIAGSSTHKNVVYKSVALGFAAGIGALVLPKPLGLSEAPNKRTTTTAVLTVALYTFGGLASGIAMKLLQKRKGTSVPVESMIM
ncbi:MAG: hypothetical protein JWP88_2300 [Flaviaesturariibacter sp.]|nr:hypothetical protein [Flaviaesturariibacter sp.]